jgi:hypothetical protein
MTPFCPPDAVTTPLEKLIDVASPNAWICPFLDTTVGDVWGFGEGSAPEKTRFLFPV